MIKSESKYLCLFQHLATNSTSTKTVTSSKLFWHSQFTFCQSQSTDFWLLPQLRADDKFSGKWAVRNRAARTANVTWKLFCSDKNSILYYLSYSFHLFRSVSYRKRAEIRIWKMTSHIFAWCVCFVCSRDNTLFVREIGTVLCVKKCGNTAQLAALLSQWLHACG